METMTRTRTTLATFKAFLRKNEGRLLIRELSDFDGMTDCVQHNPHARFRPLERAKNPTANNLGFGGIWLCLHGRDWFTPFEDAERIGIHAYNCCGSFDVAVPKGGVA